MGKGKVYPSPPAGGETAEAVLLRLLPAAVLAMAAPLGAEGKEVLAYLVLASLRSSAPPTPAREETSEGAGVGRKAHRPELGCGCFGCYTAYWSRWDGSPERDREAIHRAIEAFEEHLDKKDEGKGGRRRKKRAAAAAAKDKARKGKELAAVEPPPPEQEETVAAAAAPAKVDDFGEEAKADKEQGETVAAAAALAKVDDGGEQAKADKGATTSAAAAGDGVEERRRRGWGAVAGVFNWRGWALWGSH